MDSIVRYYLPKGIKHTTMKNSSAKKKIQKSTFLKKFKININLKKPKKHHTLAIEEDQNEDIQEDKSSKRKH